jgi:hypothetical protein
MACIPPSCTVALYTSCTPMHYTHGATHPSHALYNATWHACIHTSMHAYMTSHVGMHMVEGYNLVATNPFCHTIMHVTCTIVTNTPSHMHMPASQLLCIIHTCQPPAWSACTSLRCAHMHVGAPMPCMPLCSCVGGHAATCHFQPASIGHTCEGALDNPR